MQHSLIHYLTCLVPVVGFDHTLTLRGILEPPMELNMHGFGQWELEDPEEPMTSSICNCRDSLWRQCWNLVVSGCWSPSRSYAQSVWAAVGVDSAQVICVHMDVHSLIYSAAFGKSRSVCLTNRCALFPTRSWMERLSSAWLLLGLSHSLSLTSQDGNQDLSPLIQLPFFFFWPQKLNSHTSLMWDVECALLFCFDSSASKPPVKFRLLWAETSTSLEQRAATVTQEQWSMDQHLISELVVNSFIS